MVFERWKRTRGCEGRGALVTALATLALWRVTRVLAVESLALARMTSRPFVVRAFESSGASAVALRNTGNATAFDIKLEMSRALPKHNGEKLAYQIEAKDGFRSGWNIKGPRHKAEELEKLRKQMRKL